MTIKIGMIPKIGINHLEPNEFTAPSKFICIGTVFGSPKVTKIKAIKFKTAKGSKNFIIRIKYLTKSINLIKSMKIRENFY